MKTAPRCTQIDNGFNVARKTSVESFEISTSPRNTECGDTFAGSVLYGSRGGGFFFVFAERPDSYIIIIIDTVCSRDFRYYSKEKIVFFFNTKRTELFFASSRRRNSIVIGCIIRFYTYYVVRAYDEN